MSHSVFSKPHSEAPRFYSIQEILDALPEWVGKNFENQSELIGQSIHVSRPSDLRQSGSGDLAYFFSKRYQADLLQAQPGILIVGLPFVAPLRAAGLPLWKTTAVISCKDPYAAMAILSEKFASTLSHNVHFPSAEPRVWEVPQIHHSAVVAASAEIGVGARIGPFCVIGEGVQIGSGTIVGSGCSIGPESVLGQDCVLFSNVTLYERTEIGNRVRIHAGAVIGSDGFGYAPTTLGHKKIHHFGCVKIEDDVEIGANACIDRGTLGATRIGKNSKLDNLVHVGHNCELDEGAIICGGTCLAGNASVGRYAYVGGLTGVGNHVHVGAQAQVGALTMVTKNVPVGGTAVGNPQREYQEHFKAHAMLGQLLKNKKKSRRT